MEVADVGDRRGFEVGHAPDRRVLVRVRRERVVVDDLRQPAVRLVLDAHPPLFLDHLALATERFVVDAQRRHPIRFEPERQRQVVGRQRLPEDGLVFGRVGVAATADAGDDRRVRIRLHVLRALEHHVLEEMREPGAAGTLVLRSDVIPDRDVHDWRRVILGQDHAEPVRQRRDLILEFRRPDRAVERRRRDDHEGGGNGREALRQQGTREAHGMIIPEVSGLADESRRSPSWRSRTGAGRDPRGARRRERTPSHPRRPRRARRLRRRNPV